MTGLDQFGIKMLNPTKSGGRTFFMPALATSTVSSTKRVGNTEMVMHGQGSVTVGQTEYKISGSAPRLYVYSTDFNKTWNDLEITCYYNIVAKASAPSYAGMTIGARSIHHLQNNPCDTYYSKHTFDQRCYFQKELVHPTSSSANISVPKKPFNSNTWYGMKFILRETKLEQWRDETDGKDGGDWKKVTEFTDNGNNWSGRVINSGKACFIRTDGVSDFRIKKFSIRTIGSEPIPEPEPEPEPEPITTKPKITTIGATTYLNLAYENINGEYVPITTLTGSHSLPFDGVHAKRITIDGKQYVYLYYYRAVNRFNTLGRIPLS